MAFRKREDPPVLPDPAAVLRNVIPGTRTPKETVRILSGRGYQPRGIQELLPHLTIAQIEAVLDEVEA